MGAAIFFHVLLMVVWLVLGGYFAFYAESTRMGMDPIWVGIGCFVLAAWNAARLWRMLSRGRAGSPT